MSVAQWLELLTGHQTITRLIPVWESITFLIFRVDERRLFASNHPEIATCTMFASNIQIVQNEECFFILSLLWVGIYSPEGYIFEPGLSQL